MVKARPAVPQHAKAETEESITSERSDYYRAAVGPNHAEYYLSRFSRFDAQGAGATWNWPAFFLSFFWLLYRKMYMWAAVYFLTPVPLAVIAGMAGNETAAMSAYVAYLVAIWIIFPMYANGLYYRHVCAKIEGAATTLRDEAQRLQLVAANGGVGSAAFIGVLLSVPVIGILAAIALPAYQDYTVRAQVSQGLIVGSMYKVAMAEYLAATDYEACPGALSDIGMSEWIPSGSVARVSLDNQCVISLTLAGNTAVKGKVVRLVPSLSDDNELVWSCESDIANKYLPSNCRT